MSSKLAQAGVKVATIFRANFAEAGSDGKKLQNEMMQIAREGNVRIVGPNCMGVYCMDPPAIISPNRIMQIPKIEKGNIGVISQSGSLTGTFVSRGQHRGLAFSKIVSIGNECDVSISEIAEIMVDDAKTKIILMFLETIRDYKAFAKMARRLLQIINLLWFIKSAGLKQLLNLRHHIREPLPAPTAL